jgi:inosine/xanthosine triphosphate pyrophosphatase family protein
LSAEEQMMYDQQIGVTGQGYKNLEAQTAEQRGLLLQRYQDTLESMKRGGYESGQQLREQLSEGGLGFSPMFLGKGMRDIAQQTANEAARLTAERTAQEEAMTRQLDISRRERDAELERLRIQSLIDRSAKLRQGIAK